MRLHALITCIPVRRLTAFITGLMIISALTAQWRQVQFDDSDMALDLTEAFTFQKYPTYDQYVEMMQTFARDFPGVCRLDTFGTTVEGRMLLALKISDNVQIYEPEANFLYSSTMHGDELVGFVLLLRLADYLVKGYGTDSEVTGLVDSLAIWINPLANPDGSYYPDNNASLKESRRWNADSIDLNRDFPDPSKAEPDNTNGRALETRAMMLFMKRHGFTLSANIHSGTEVVNYPWDHTYDLHADDPWYRFVSREYADEARAVDPEYMSFYEDGITNGAQWYRIYGGRQDYVNYYLEGREVTLELSNAYRLGSEFLEEFWNINRRSLLNYMSQGMYGIRGRVTDLESGEPVRALIFIPGHDTTYSVVHSFADHGDFYRLIREGAYDVVASAPGYLNDTLRNVAVTDYTATFLNFRMEPLYGTHVQPDMIIPGFTIYPNPAANRLFVKPHHVKSGMLEIGVYSVDGKLHLLHSCYYDGQQVILNTEGLRGGFYILRIHTEGLSGSMRFIKQ